MLIMALCEWKKSMDAETLNGAERPSPSDLEVVAEQLAWGHPQEAIFPGI